MSIPIKWQYEIMKFINVEIEIQERIILHEYFKIFLKIKNLLNNKIFLDLEVGDSFFTQNELCFNEPLNRNLEQNL